MAKMPGSKRPSSEMKLKRRCIFQINSLIPRIMAGTSQNLIQIGSKFRNCRDFNDLAPLATPEIGCRNLTPVATAKWRIH